ncbi:MAG: hypothetical protein ACYC2K_18195, partial [Gemmatimonadales bacterium]
QIGQAASAMHKFFADQGAVPGGSLDQLEARRDKLVEFRRTMRGGLFNQDGALDREIARIDNVIASAPWRNVIGGSSTTEVPGLPVASGGSSGAKVKAGTSDARRQAEEAARAAQAAMEAQYGWNQSILDLAATLDGPAAEAQREYERNISKLNADFNEGKVALADYAKAEELYAEQRDRSLEAIKAMRTPAQRMLEDLALESELLGKSREQQELLTAARYLGAEAATDQGKAALAALVALQEQSKAIADQIDMLDGARDSARGFLDDLHEGVGIWDSLKNAAGNFADVLYRMASDRIIEQLFGKSGTAETGSSGGWINALFGSSGSSQGSLLDLFSGAWGFASGGTMAANSIARVNERGFEMATVGGNDYLLTGNSPVEITPNHKLGAGGSVTQIFNNPVMSNAQTEFQRAAYQARKAQRAMARS